VPFIDEIGVVGERTDGAGSPRRGWLTDIERPADAPAGRVAGAAWLLTRPGRYGRAMMLREHLRERWVAGSTPGEGAGEGEGHVGRRRRRVRRPAHGFVLWSVRRLDAEAVRRWTVLVAVRWALVTSRLSRRRPRAEAAVGSLAAPLALPAVVLAVAVIVVLAAADVGLVAVLAVGGSIRTAVGARHPKDVGARTFDWTPS
jgi:hypothetical protein